MGLFFGTRSKVKRKKAVIFLKIIISIGLIITIVLQLINGFNFKDLNVMFILLGVNSLIDGIEGYYQKQERKYYLLDLGLAGVYLLVFIQNLSFNY